MFQAFLDAVVGILSNSGFAAIFTGDGWKFAVMIAIACGLLYLAIVKKFEPLLLLPIAFGMLLANLPGANVFHPELFDGGHIDWSVIGHVIPGVHESGPLAGQEFEAGILDILYLGVKLGIYPPLIFLGIGCMTDFGPLISNPKSFLLGAAAQVGIFAAFVGALTIGSIGIPGLVFDPKDAGSIGIIGGADGPTAIFVTSKLSPELLGPIAVAAYSYMALIPFIQKPIMKLLTTRKERLVRMSELRTVSKTEKIIFPIMVTIIVSLLIPDAAPLVGMLMLGNLMKESGVVERICKTAQNELMNIVTIFLGITVGATTNAASFLNAKTLGIVLMGLVAFCISTASGVMFGKLMYLLTGGKVNPLIGSAGVSAVPMAARVSQQVGQEEDPGNFLLMHAMGPNVAGVIGSAVAAGVLLQML